jgi:hypothetical protein
MNSGLNGGLDEGGVFAPWKLHAACGRLRFCCFGCVDLIHPRGQISTSKGGFTST